MDIWECLVIALAVAATVGVLVFVRRHGIVLRPDAEGLEAVPREIHEAEQRRQREQERGGTKAPVPDVALRSVFLDRDGTLIEDRHYLADPAGVVLLPGAAAALARLAGAGCDLFLVSNQSGVGRGYFSEADVRACQKRLDDLLEDAGVRLTEAVWCPHAPEAGCRCRKPLPGLWERLAAARGLDPRASVMIGDKAADLHFAFNAGFAAAVLVLTGEGENERAGWPLPPEDAGFVEIPPHGSCRIFVARNLPAAATALLSAFRADSRPA